MKNIILFGEMGSGKSTVAHYIELIYGHRVMSLGRKIHQECKLHGKETREELQQYGQMMRKIFGKDIWCDYLIKQVDLKKENIVIDDARQLNEFEYFTSKGFIPIGVVADEEVRLKRLKNRVNYEVKKESEKHETEVQARQNIERCKLVIENNGNNIQELVLQIRDKLNKIMYHYK
jgi:dephospho-CoA kinase